VDQNRGDVVKGRLLYELFYHRLEEPQAARSEPVVLATILPHSVNVGLEIRGNALVDKINGYRIDRLEDVPRAFGQAQGQGSDWIEFLPDHNIEALERKDVASAQAEILKAYAVPADRRL
jgi:hypothetical protein